MKYIYIAFALLFVSFFYTSCIEDTGNYDYTNPEELMPIVISGFDDTTVIRNSELKIEPVVENMSDESRYSHIWYAIPTSSQGSSPKRDTLSVSKNLSAQIKYQGGEYSLYYQIRDKKLDVYTYRKITLTVTESVIGTGWYILKDINDETDFDYVNLEDELHADVLRNISGNKQLKGNAVKIIFQASGYYHRLAKEDGTFETLSNQSVLHIISTKDMKTLNAKNMTLFKNYEDEFYGLPEKNSPQTIENSGNDIYLINGGKIYTIYGMSPNIGIFSAPKVGIYDLHSDIVVNMYAGMFFDNTSHSFLNCTTGGTTLNTFPESDKFLSLTNMNVRLLNLMQGTASNSTSVTGYALMQSLTNGSEYYLASVNLKQTSTYPFTSFDTIPSNCLMPKAEVKAVPTIGSFVYYAYDNKLYVYKDAKDLAVRESLIKEFPAGEKISCIKNFLKTKTGGGYEYMYIAVLTNSASGWKMYLFDLIGLGNPDINPVPVKVFQGKGNARYIMYR